MLAEGRRLLVDIKQLEELLTTLGVQ
jgi:hypothetical protein